MMDREKLIEAAAEFRTKNANNSAYYPSMDGSNYLRYMADFALSLFQWKDVADGLPEATGLFVASIKGRGLTITGFAVDSDLDKWRWEDKYDRYIPYPIPIYEEGAQ